MTTRRCGTCASIIGQGCDCPPDEDRPSLRWILISPSGEAHRPGLCGGCPRSPEEAGWGWITDPPTFQWIQISENRPARATGGDTELIAMRRCWYCETILAGI